MKWEYQAQKLTTPVSGATNFEESIETQLDRQGDQGWELVNLVEIDNRWVAIFKKPAES